MSDATVIDRPQSDKGQEKGRDQRPAEAPSDDMGAWTSLGDAASDAIRRLAEKMNERR